MLFNIVSVTINYSTNGHQNGKKEKEKRVVQAN